MYPHEIHHREEHILSVEDLSVLFNGRPALEKVSFHLKVGERVAVVGPNGAGKSTLFKVIAGVLPPTKGEVKVYGSQPGVHICIAYLPQRSQVDWRFPVSVGDVVMMGRIAKLGLFGWPRRADWDLVQNALRKVGMAELKNRQIGQLSGGQQQRMFIARSLAQEAELMMMDEPATGLDLPSQEALLSSLENLRVEGVTLMVATHDLDHARRYFDRILLLNRRVVAFGRPEEALTPDSLLSAYGGRLESIDGRLITDTCCEEDEHGGHP
jgi:manganese/iron transport system ATP-binding protein